MNKKDFSGEWKQVSFELKKQKRVPEESGIYLLTNFSGDVLYIGVSINLRRRFKEHLDSSKAFDLTPKGRSFWFYYSLCLEREQRSRERGLLFEFELREGSLPWFNKVYPPT